MCRFSIFARSPSGVHGRALVLQPAMAKHVGSKAGLRCASYDRSVGSEGRGVGLDPPLECGDAAENRMLPVLGVRHGSGC